MERDRLPSAEERAAALLCAAEKQRVRWEAVRSGVVYLIGMDGSSLVKIGFTTGDPAKRLAQLQTGAPGTLRLLSTHSGEEALEKALHKRFAAYRTRGEWFELSAFQSDPAWIVAGAVAEIETG